MSPATVSLSFLRRSAAALALCLVVPALATPLTAQSMPPRRAPHTALAPAAASTQAPPPLRLAERAGAAPLAALRSAEEGAADQLAALAAWNRTRRVPWKIGFSRPLLAPRRVTLGALAPEAKPAPLGGGLVGRSASGGTVWSASVQVAGAYRLRLHLAAVALPDSARLWVWGRGGTAHAFAPSLRGADGGLWTPGVTGDTIYLEVEVPAAALAAPGPTGAKGAARFALDAVSQSFRLDAKGQPIAALAPREGECLVDVSCVKPAAFAHLDDLEHAVGLLDFLDTGGEFLCSGGLLNDVAEDGIPYMLTANHCFDNQTSASSLIVFWDFRSASCNGASPDLDSLPASEGATLLATDPQSDFTFLRLASVPAGRTFLGWNAAASAVGEGVHLFRASQALGDKLTFSMSIVHTAGVPVCDDAPRPDFLYATDTSGGTFGGSSGAPAVLADGSVVGQLLGGCGVDDPENGCDYTNSELDGAFSVTYPKIALWLSQPGHVTPAPCIAGPATLCLLSGRFQVDATFDAGASGSGTAQAVPLTDDSGYLWFFSAANVESVVKVLDGCPVDQRYWVFSGGLTDVQVVLRVIDTVNGTVRTYINPTGTAFQPIQDTGAFATCP